MKPASSNENELAKNNLKQKKIQRIGYAILNNFQEELLGIPANNGHYVSNNLVCRFGLAILRSNQSLAISSDISRRAVKIGSKLIFFQTSNLQAANLRFQF